eukprot:COSAG01_NODE_38_length_33931_cov_75.163632_3_plen_477_part_00
MADLQKCSDSNRAALHLNSANAASESTGMQSKFDLAKGYSSSEINDTLREYQFKYPDLTETPLHLVDINNDFAVLPNAWQRTNLELGGQSLELCYNHDDLDNDVLADAVHKQWLEANPWAKAGPLGVPYEELSPVEQAKDMSQVLTCNIVISVLEELRRDFTEYSDGKQLLEAGGLIKALDAYCIETGDPAAHATHDNPVDFEQFCRLVLPDVEKRIAQDLFGVDMVSVVEQIRLEKRMDGDDDTRSTARSMSSTQTAGTGGRLRTDSLLSEGTPRVSSPLSRVSSTMPPLGTGASGFHIFVSYRRTGLATARSVKQALEMRGYHCFMDFEALTVGNFQKELESALQGTPIVVVCLTPGSLTKDARWPGAGRAEEGSIDYLQREVDLALAMNKLIIPVRTPDFEIEKEFNEVTPSTIKELRNLNIVELSNDYFDPSIDKIHTCIENRMKDEKYGGPGDHAARDKLAMDSPWPREFS